MLTDLNKIKFESNRKTHVNLGMIHGNSSILIPCFGQSSQILKTKYLVQTLISQRNTVNAPKEEPKNLRTYLQAVFLKLSTNFSLKFQSASHRFLL